MHVKSNTIIFYIICQRPINGQRIDFPNRFFLKHILRQDLDSPLGFFSSRWLENRTSHVDF